MRDQSGAPEDFVSYVDSRLPALENAANRLTGDDVQAERLSQDLLTLVALRWRRLSRADAQAGLEPGESADVYLSRLFRQETFDQGAPQVPLRLDVLASRRRRRAGQMNPGDEAALVWERARRTIRRRLLLGAGAAGILGIFAICQRGRGDDSAEPEQLDQRPTALPSGAQVAPATPGAAVSVGRLPAQIAFPDGDLALLTNNPVRGAILVMAAFRTDTSPILVLGDDGGWRRVDTAPALSALWLHAGSLSPTGQYVALGTSTGTTVVDLTTGRAQQYTVTPEPTRPIWLGPNHLVLGVKNLLDVSTGKTSAFPTIPTDMVTQRHLPRSFDPATDPTGNLVELLSVGQPATAAARVRHWTKAGTELVTQVNGPLAELVGPWRGGGFGYGGGEGLIARVCATTGAANAGAAVALVHAKTARVERVLLIDSARAGGLRLLGWANEQRVLLSFAGAGTQQVVAWDWATGGTNLVSTVRGDGLVTLPDLT